MLGKNDSKKPNWNKESYEKDLTDLIKSYKDLPSRPDIYLMMPPRALPTAAALNNMQIQRDVVANDIPEIIRKISTNLKTKLISLSNLFITTNDPDHIFEKSEPGYWTYDGVHPNDRGYKIIADFVYKSFNRKTYYGKLMPLN
jgi:lysophospholipase L1-like esterase